MTIFVDGWLNVPAGVVDGVASATHRALRDRFTFIPRKSSFNPDPEPISYFRMDGGMLQLPIDAGLQEIVRMDLSDPLVIDDRTSLGADNLNPPLRPDPNNPHATVGQAEFIESIKEEAAGHFSVLAVADTGAGKTVSCLSAVADLGRRTLIMVHRERIAVQWAREAIKHLGMDESDIGFIRGNNQDFDKPLVIGMMQTIIRRKWTHEQRTAFGTVVTDEVHNVAAPTMSGSMGVWHAKHKIALTATDTRKDGGEVIFKDYFGPARARHAGQAMPCEIVPLDFHTSKKTWGNSPVMWAKCLSKDSERNDCIIQLAKSVYDKGRHVLLIGDLLDHLGALGVGLLKAGVPASQIGYFLGEARDASGERFKTTKEYLDWCEKHPRIVLASYGMMKEAINIPRLDAGIDVTPKSQGVQVLGRIRRPLVGKPTPVWYTIKDLGFPQVMGLFNSRMRDYRSISNVSVRNV